MKEMRKIINLAISRNNTQQFDQEFLRCAHACIHIYICICVCKDASFFVVDFPFLIRREPNHIAKEKIFIEAQHPRNMRVIGNGNSNS